MEQEAGNPTGPATTEVDTLDADLNKAFDASEKSTETTAETKTDKTTDVSEAARTLASQRKTDRIETATDKIDPAAEKRKAEIAALPPEEREKLDAEEKAKTETFEAPAHWPAADREMFAKAPREMQQWALNRHKAMEADYTKKTQELASVRRVKETLDEVFAPFRDQMQMSGIDEATAIRQLVGAHAFLQRDPGGAIKKLAEQYGIELKGLVEGAAAADPAGESPTVKALRTQVESLTGELKKFTGAQTEQQQNARLTEVSQFAEEKDAQGQLLRPHFDEVAKDIAGLIHAARQTGEKLTLQDAYDRAIHANPLTREKVLAARDAQRRAKEEAERKAKADAAKKAGFEVKGEGAATSVAAQNDSIDAALNAAWDAQAGRV